MISSKIKYIASGIIIGSILSSSLVFAQPIQQFVLNKVSYPIIVNGAAYNDEQLPVLNYEGTTYVPLKKLSDLLNCNVQWNNELGRVEIGQVKNTVNQSQQQTSSQQTVQTQTLQQQEINTSDTKTYQKDGYTFIIENGVEYYPVQYILGTTLYSKGYDLGYNKETNTMFLAYNDKPGWPVNNYETILEGIPVKLFNGQSYIPKDSYLNKILPLVK